MSQWLTQVIDDAKRVDDFLAPMRQQALSKLQTQGWPHARSEEWRLTPLTSIKERTVEASSVAVNYIVPQIKGLNPIDLVFVDGVLVTNLNDIRLPTGLSVYALSDAPSAAQTKITALFGHVKPTRHVFGLVNDAICQQGIYIEVDENCSIDTPLRIVNLATKDCDAHTRALVNLGKNSQLKVIEHGSGSAASFTTAFAEYAIGQEARLEHYRFAFFTGAAKQVGGSHFSLQDKANLNSTLVAYGSELSRLDVDIIHAGEHANAKMNAIYLLAEGEFFDLHSTIEHAMPNGTTEENARGIIGDRARAVFSGRIHIHRDAQKTLAELNNRNLLLSRRAMINTKPELEIYADDVKCAHGATVAEIEEQALYYLLSRGIKRSKALVMLNFGFIQELVNDIDNENIRTWLSPMLSERFASMEVK
ncbi:Fe-S cluster assembly protein SufD [Glaciecola punicea]|uniref:Fe-S cluster assembly protein SufD n=1 Tax=Glaciecola punicea TaxID=56804 RepID=UPI0008720D44|nr:Fe-S cluster assembly protein SufD [Glaciecola punicea]OFA31892.1 Fe-S cluster assembly protein SufD [Glaciecola punicea]